MTLSVKRVKKFITWMFFVLFTFSVVSAATFLLYCNTLSHVSAETIGYYEQLKTELIKQRYKDELIVISAKRANWHNNILTLFGASSRSRHLKGDAIDIMVMDVNADGQINGKDVDIVYAILDKQIVKGKGGLGTYKSDFGIWNRQMVHLDCRQKRTRWH
jgi:uncharacterized protein YcbK (DUF882 family)